MAHCIQLMKRTDGLMQRQGAGIERLFLEMSLSGSALAREACKFMQGGRTTDASPTAWTLVRRLPQRLSNRA